MCSDSDLKDLGLPMGPRKKLQGLLQEQIQKKVSDETAAVHNVEVGSKHLIYLYGLHISDTAYDFFWFNFFDSMAHLLKKA